MEIPIYPKMRTLFYFLLALASASSSAIAANEARDREVSYSIPALLAEAEACERLSSSESASGSSLERASTIYKLLEGILQMSGPSMNDKLRSQTARRVGWFYYRNARDDRDRAMGRQLVSRALEADSADALTRYCHLKIMFDSVEAKKSQISGDEHWRSMDSVAKSLQSLLKQRPSFPEAYLLLGFCYFSLANSDKAELAFWSMRNTLWSFTPELNGFSRIYPKDHTIALPDGSILQPAVLPER